MSAAPRASSPCTGVCRIDPVSGLCLGCARSLDEIAHWARLSEGQRLALMAELPARRPRLPAASPTSSKP